MWKLWKLQVSYYNKLEFSIIKDDIMVFSSMAVLGFMRANIRNLKKNHGVERLNLNFPAWKRTPES